MASTTSTEPGIGRGSTASAARPPIRFMGRRSTSAALLLGALLNATASFINTAFLPGGPAAAGYTEALSERGTLGMTGVLLNIAGIPLMLAGIAGLVQLASPTAPLLSRTALAASTVGMVAFLCMNGALVALYGLGSGGGAGAEAAELQLTGTGTAMLAMLLPFLLGNAVGMVCTAAALLKSRVVAPWIPITLLVFFVADFILPGTPFFDAHLIFVAFAAGAAWSVWRRGREPFAERAR